MKNSRFSYEKPSEKKTVLTKSEVQTIRGGGNGDDDKSIDEPPK